MNEPHSRCSDWNRFIHVYIFNTVKQFLMSTKLRTSYVNTLEGEGCPELHPGPHV